MKLEVTSCNAPARVFFDLPYRDGIANLKSAFQKTPESGEISQGSTADKAIAVFDRVRQAIVGGLLLIPIANIVIDLVLRHFAQSSAVEKTPFQRQWKANLYMRETYYHGRGQDERIQGGYRGVINSLSNVIKPKINQLIGQNRLQCRIVKDLERSSSTGVSYFFLALKIKNNDGTSTKWQRKIEVYSTAESHVQASEKGIIKDILSKFAKNNPGFANVPADISLMMSR